MKKQLSAIIALILCGILASCQKKESPVQPETPEDVISTIDITCQGVTFSMVKVAGGTFQMGSTDGEETEQPVHSVTLSDYYIGQTEVTQALWQAVMGSNPSKSVGDSLPVEQVSWTECQTFISRLNALTGKTFSLPTEAQWEFAARGGVRSRGYLYAGSDTIDNVAWYSDNSLSHTHSVGTLKANELGLYDMSGNVWELCQDWFGAYTIDAQTDPAGPDSGTGRVGRGGSWSISSSYCRNAYRRSFDPEGTYSVVGLRLTMK